MGIYEYVGVIFSNSEEGAGRGAIDGKTPNNIEVFYQKVRHFIGLT